VVAFGRKVEYYFSNVNESGFRKAVLDWIGRVADICRGNNLGDVVSLVLVFFAFKRAV
jgi:hypothetical protein